MSFRLCGIPLDGRSAPWLCYTTLVVVLSHAACTRLFVPESFYGIQARGAACGPDTKEEADPYRHRDAQCGRPERDGRGQTRKDQRRRPRYQTAHNQPEDSADHGEHYRLGQELYDN